MAYFGMSPEAASHAGFLSGRSLVGTIEPRKGKNGFYYIVAAQLDLRDPRNTELPGDALQVNPYLGNTPFVVKSGNDAGRMRVTHGVVYSKQQGDIMLRRFRTRVNTETRKIEFAGKANLFPNHSKVGEPTFIIVTKGGIGRGSEDYTLDEHTLENQAGLRDKIAALARTREQAHEPGRADPTCGESDVPRWAGSCGVDDVSDVDGSGAGHDCPDL